MRKAIYQQIEMKGYNDQYPCKSIEEEISQATTSNQPIENVAPLIYTERSEGVLPEYDIRTDRWELAQKAMDKVAGSYRAKRQERIEKQKTQSTDNQTENAA